MTTHILKDAEQAGVVAMPCDQFSTADTDNLMKNRLLLTYVPAATLITVNYEAESTGCLMSAIFN